MGRRSKTLDDYDHPDIENIDPEFNEVTSQDDVKYKCIECEVISLSKKRLLAARLLKGNRLRCLKCKNKANRKKK